MTAPLEWFLVKGTRRTAQLFREDGAGPRISQNRSRRHRAHTKGTMMNARCDAPGNRGTGPGDIPVQPDAQDHTDTLIVAGRPVLTENAHGLESDMAQHLTHPLHEDRFTHL